VRAFVIKKKMDIGFLWYKADNKHVDTKQELMYVYTCLPGY